MLAQKGRPGLLVSLVDGLADGPRVLAQRDPDQITARQVVALGPRLAALALFPAGELLKAAVQCLDLSAHLHRLDDHFPARVSSQGIGDDPFPAAVRGNQLE